MRPMISAVVVAVVLLTAAFLFVVPTQDRALTTPAHTSTGLRAAVTPSYYVALGFATQPVLPGYHDSLLYEVLNHTNGAPIETLSTITILATYYNTALQPLTLPGTPINVSTAPIGSFTFLVPANASTNGFYPPVFTVWANSTSLQMNQSSPPDALEVGNLAISSANVCDVSGTCGTLTTGNPATVSVNAQVIDTFGSQSPAYNETVKFLFFSTGSSPVTVPGVPTSLKTDSQGNAALTFTPSSTVFNVPGPDHVEIEITDSVNASLSVYVNVTFTLLNPVGTTNFAFWLNAATYYSGSTVTAAWQWAGTNATVGTLNVTNYYVFDDATGNIIANGLIGSTSPTGSFTFTLPTTYYGSFTVDANVHNGSDAWTLQAGAYATEAIFAILPSEFYYNPGDTITVTVTALGPALSGATISAFVQAYNSGQTLFNSTVTGGSFQFTVPAVAPATEYLVSAWASTPTAGTIATSSGYVAEASGYSFTAGISTASSYSDGSFAPGQVVQLNYKITPYGTSTPASLTEIALFPGACSLVCITNTPALKVWLVSGASGSVPFTIPAGTPNGLQSFNVIGFWNSGDGASQLTVNVNSAPSALNYEIGAGSGLTVGWLILLILVIIVALVIVMMRRRSKPSTMVMSPASPAVAAAPEWKEQPSGGSMGGSSDASSPPPGTH